MPSSLPLLLETIKCEDGKVYHLDYHQKRVDRSAEELFGLKERLDLFATIQAPKKGLYRCRILYRDSIESVEYFPYTPKTINKLRVVPSSVSYPYKFADRSTLDHLLQLHLDVDEIIIEQEGLITDTTIANIAFFDGEKWVTPKKPLLEGTTRKRLIDEGFLHTKDIASREIGKYQQVALMNAMIGFKIINPKIIMNNDKRTKGDL